MTTTVRAISSSDRPPRIAGQQLGEELGADLVEGSAGGQVVREQEVHAGEDEEDHPPGKADPSVEVHGRSPACPQAAATLVGGTANESTVVVSCIAAAVMSPDRAAKLGVLAGAGPMRPTGRTAPVVADRMPWRRPERPSVCRNGLALAIDAPGPPPHPPAARRGGGGRRKCRTEDGFTSFHGSIAPMEFAGSRASQAPAASRRPPLEPESRKPLTEASTKCVGAI